MNHQEEDDACTVMPDRPTFFHFTPARRSPFAHYFKNFVVENRPPPFRPVHERLGLSEEEFEARLTLEINSVLKPLADTRRRDKDLEDESLTAPSATIPALPVMTKEDGL